ncbi:MAG: SRPBCC family protein [Phyllobacterium sp.]
MDNEQGLSVTVRRRFDASAERVFDAWLDADMARKWLFATDQGQITRAEIEPRVGGKFVIVDRRDGEDVEHVGEYRVIDRPHRLVFLFGIPAFDPEPDEITISISRLDTGCELTLIHVMKARYEEYRDRTAEGWTKMLGALSVTLEGRS